MNRRHFAAASLSALTARNAFTQSALKQNTTIHAEVLIGTMRPELHAHFARRLGSWVYGGLCTTIALSATTVVLVEVSLA